MLAWFCALTLHGLTVSLNSGRRKTAALHRHDCALSHGALLISMRFVCLQVIPRHMPVDIFLLLVAPAAVPVEDVTDPADNGAVPEGYKRHSRPGHSSHDTAYGDYRREPGLHNGHGAHKVVAPREEPYWSYDHETPSYPRFDYDKEYIYGDHDLDNIDSPYYSKPHKRPGVSNWQLSWLKVPLPGWPCSRQELVFAMRLSLDMCCNPNMLMCNRCDRKDTIACRNAGTHALATYR